MVTIKKGRETHGPGQIMFGQLHQVTGRWAILKKARQISLLIKG